MLALHASARRALGQDDVLGACVVLTRAFAGTPEEISYTDATRYVEGCGRAVPRSVLYVARIYPDGQCTSSYWG